MKVCLLMSPLVIMLCGVVGCGGNGTAGVGFKGSGTTSGPAISSISPTTEPAGGPSFLLTVNGTNFIQGATVSWGGFSLNANYVSSTELQA